MVVVCDYSCVHISSDEVFFQDSEETIHSEEKKIPHMKAKVILIGKNQKPNSKWQTKKKPRNTKNVPFACF